MTLAWIDVVVVHTVVVVAVVVVVVAVVVVAVMVVVPRAPADTKARTIQTTHTLAPTPLRWQEDTSLQLARRKGSDDDDVMGGYRHPAEEAWWTMAMMMMMTRLGGRGVPRRRDREERRCIGGRGLRRSNCHCQSQSLRCTADRVFFYLPVNS